MEKYEITGIQLGIKLSYNIQNKNANTHKI